MNDMRTIQVHDLVVEYQTAAGPLRALDCPDFRVPGGTSVAITGPSGCGKSTLLGVISGLTAPTSGVISIGPTEITSLSETERVAFRRHAIGVVYQADNLLPFLTVSENIRLQLALCGDTDEAERRTTNLLERLGLGALAERLPDQLSGGQRQRAAVARAIVHRPAVILADEPTGALDEENAAAVIQLLVDARRQLGSTLVVVTHEPGIARAMDRQVSLREGSIVADREAPYVHQE